MHELSLAQSMVEVLERQARIQHFRRVKQIWLEINALACVEEQALRFGFEVASRETLAHDAQLHIDTVATPGWCMACSQPIVIAEIHSPCPHCGSWQLQLDTGNELRVTRLEVE